MMKQTMIETLIVALLLAHSMPALSTLPEEAGEVDARGGEESHSSGKFEQAGDYFWLNDQKVELLRAVSEYAVGFKEEVPLTEGNVTMKDQESNFVITTTPIQSTDPDIDWTGPVFFNTKDDVKHVVTNKIVVKLDDGVDPEVFFAQDAFSSYRLLRGTTDQFVAKLNEKRSDLNLKFANALHELNDDAVWASPNFLMEVEPLLLPSDPLFLEQWQHMNRGQTGGTIGADCNMVRAWDVAKAHRNTIVAILDNGVEHSHPDLIMYHNPGEMIVDRIDNDNNGRIDDYSGWNFKSNNNRPDVIDFGRDDHGTMVAGMAAAASNNKGVVGSAFGARVLSVKLIEGAYMTESASIAEAIYYAAGQAGNRRGYWRGADVINISLLLAVTTDIHEAVKWATFQGRGGLGVPIFASAGNKREQTLSSFSRLSETIAVGSSNATDQRGASSYGPGLDFLAPGDNVLTTDLGGVIGKNPGRGVYTQDSGSNGIVSLEAETGRPLYIHGKDDWNVFPCAGICSGAYAMEVGPDDGDVDLTPEILKRLTWEVNFQKTGTHYIWVRGYAKNYGSNTCHVGFGAFNDIPHTGASTSVRISVYNEWVWSRRTISGYVARFDIPTLGTHFMMLWMREDGFRFDKLILTTNPNYEPTGMGPEMSMNSNFPDWDYVSNTGTSLASQMAAGIGALLITANPEITADEVRQTMRDTADKVGGVNYDTQGWHQEYGYGRINAHKALTWSTKPILKGMDIGFVSKTGVYSPPNFPDDSYKMESRGSGIDGSSDDFHFAFMKASGDYDMIVRVNNVDANFYINDFSLGNVKGGLMIRASLIPESKFVGIFMHRDGINRLTFQHRLHKSDNAIEVRDSHVSSPYWVKLEKRGNQVAGFKSSNGITWYQVRPPVTVNFGKYFSVGLAATAGYRNLSVKSNYSHLSIRRVQDRHGKQPGLKAEYFKLASAPSNMPDFDALVPNVVRTETVINYPAHNGEWPGLGPKFRKKFGSRHTGYMYVERHGSYTFYPSSNDGSQMYLGNNLIINNDGTRPEMRTVQRTRILQPGYHSIKVDHFQSWGEAGLQLSWSGPNFSERIVSPNVLFHDEKLLAHWKLNDGVGRAAVDATGHGYTGILTSGNLWSSGRSGGAVYLPQRKFHYIGVPNIDVSEDAYSVSLWIRTHSLRGGIFAVVGRVGDKGYYGGGGYDRQLYLKDGDLHARIWQAHGQTEIIKTRNYVLADGQWHHIVHTFGGSEGGQKIYVDGTLGAQGSFKQSGFNWQQGVTIGNAIKPRAPLVGKIDEVKIFDGALNQEEASRLHANG